MTVGCSYRSSPVNNVSSSTESERPLRRSARLQEPAKKLKRQQPKHNPNISIPAPKSTTIQQLSPRALRLQKRNREPEQILITHPTSPLKKRKSRVPADPEVLVVKKRKEESPYTKQSQNAPPPSSPPLNPATACPITLDIVDIGLSACPTIPEPTPTTQSPAELDLTFDSALLFAPQSNSDTASPQQSQEWHEYHHPQPEILPPPPRRPRQQPLWVMACKLRVFEVERYYPRNVIRSIVAQQANDYYSVHGPPPRSWKVWNPHVDDSIADNQPSSQEHVELTSEDEEDVFGPGGFDAATQSRPQEPDDDTDDETEEDSDESEGFGGDVMQLDLPATREDGFNAELTSSISYDSVAAFNEWSQPSSPLMTTFALPPSEQQSSSQFMLPPSASYPAPLLESAASMFTETPPMMFMPMFPVSLPRLSSFKVMSLRSMFDVMSSPVEEEEDGSNFDEQMLGISQDELRIQKRRQRREGVGNGTPVDPYRRAVWASAGRGGEWMDDFGMGLGMDGFHVSSNTMPMELNPLLSGNMEGAVKQFAALQQVYEVFNGGTRSGYST